MHNGSGGISNRVLVFLSTFGMNLISNQSVPTYEDAHKAPSVISINFGIGENYAGRRGRQVSLVTTSLWYPNSYHWIFNRPSWAMILLPLARSKPINPHIVSDSFISADGSPILPLLTNEDRSKKTAECEDWDGQRKGDLIDMLILVTYVFFACTFPSGTRFDTISGICDY